MLRKAFFFISARCVLSYLIGKKVAKVTVMTSVTNSYRFNSLTFDVCISLLSSRSELLIDCDL